MKNMMLTLILSFLAAGAANARQTIEVTKNLSEDFYRLNPAKLERFSYMDIQASISIVPSPEDGRDTVRVLIDIPSCNRFEVYKHVVKERLYLLEYRDGAYDLDGRGVTTVDMGCGYYQVAVTLTKKELEIAEIGVQDPGLLLPGAVPGAWHPFSGVSRIEDGNFEDTDGAGNLEVDVEKNYQTNSIDAASLNRSMPQGWFKSISEVSQ